MLNFLGAKTFIYHRLKDIFFIFNDLIWLKTFLFDLGEI